MNPAVSDCFEYCNCKGSPSAEVCAGIAGHIDVQRPELLSCVQMLMVHRSRHDEVDTQLMGALDTSGIDVEHLPVAECDCPLQTAASLQMLLLSLR